MKISHKEPPPLDCKVGDRVMYHPVIGEPHDGKVYQVREVGELQSREPVAWLEGKAGCVSRHALSPEEASATSCPRSATRVINAARALVKHNGCLAAGAAKLCPRSNPPCTCTFCKLREALEAFDKALKP